MIKIKANFFIIKIPINLLHNQRGCITS
ncbi:hypothetical protein ALTER154_50200 [Alteromonas sp. 154]|nr:hypothetical protein ALTER154_50200 [Alteromonas sp. 154]